MDPSQLFYVGRRFDSYQFWHRVFKKYKNDNKLEFIIDNSHRLRADRGVDQSMIDKFVYHDVKFDCKFGRSRASQATERETNTYKMECPCSISLALKNSKYLEITKLHLEHENHHKNTALFYDIYSEDNKLTPEEKRAVEEMLSVDADKKRLQNLVMNKYNKTLDLKTFHNMKSKCTNSSANNLLSIVELLRTTYNADVYVYNDTETSTCKGIFYSTPTMRSDFQSWPEIVFLDGTYKLTNNGMTMMIFLVEDGNGRGQVVGVGLLATEELDVMEWMVKTFKESNKESCKKIHCFMTDKDQTERNAIKKFFPGIPTYICIFHSLKIFKKEINKPDKNLTSEERIEVAKIIEQLVYASSKKNYDDLYLQLNLAASPEFIDYYNLNWHNIKNEWTVYNIAINSLGNKTNNRLESINAKIKQVCKKNSPLSITIKDFFEWYSSHKTQSRLRTAKQFLKRPNRTVEDSARQQYINKLSKYACNKVFLEMKSSENINCPEIDKLTDTCKFGNFETSVRTCQCPFYISMHLPCKHIFAIGHALNLRLYDECFVQNQRWIKEKLVSQIFTTENTLDTIQSPISVTKKIKTKPPSVNEKRKIVNTKASKLVDIISISCGVDFEANIAVLDDLIKKLSNGLRVKVIEEDAINDLENSFKELSIYEKEDNESEIFIQDEKTEDLRQIKTPAKIIVKGRPSGFLDTTVRFKKKV
ncbi:Protein of unknown function [Cotesia congregata]|uniref:SWIM-type domain-containing protein n=1 Tax=Cotesia congregata TaxID=51543 RepID=A0A8J2HAD1_COTCN|nr:Protein of unknown function [Cotesia congregata]